MLDEEDIWRSAETIIRAHGAHASMLCADTAERWKKRGDMEAFELWVRIMNAVRKIEMRAVKGAFRKV